MLSLLRYRHIPYRFIQHGLGQPTGLPKPKVDLLPVVYLEDDTGELKAEVDTTFIIRRLESEYVGRSVIPADPALRFLDYLIEDYGDEWLTRPMFHIRWRYEPDAKMASEVLPHWGDITASDEEIAAKTAAFRKRQEERLYVVGSNDTTAPVIEDSYRRFLESFSALLKTAPYVMGERPGASDFAIYGQLTQLAQFDPTAVAMTLEHAPRVYAWVSAMDDLSGLEPSDSHWRELDNAGVALEGILIEMGRTYVPVMLANHAAALAGEAEVETEVAGKPWQHTTFKYHAHCVHWIQQEYNALSASAKTAVDAVLAGTGCDKLLNCS
jgi:glutathione S-transferase